ncbi:3'-5' exonuclease [Pedobacter mucosus]|uniref:3'-5' exonuclease n=1 Tax=Pedobacter mucosus TaxID=2895286 RepID=UPI001EE40991|nr:3'-5' exonuclease [Pedobacter mucosus]UKT65759.1 3'-5' exonuclease [Pedobacter mucosus]
MQKFFLVIDTETSGLPKSWTAPYSKENNWPHILQIAWIIYNELGIEVKRENHYFRNNDIVIDKNSFKIHGITKEYLKSHGVEKDKIMMILNSDLIKYQPIIVGHFIELDYHMLNVEFYRIGKNDILKNYQFFCTMKASAPYVYNPTVSQLKLNQFYAELFSEEPANLHNALSDAINTAKIFFHLLAKNELLDEYFYHVRSIKNLKSQSLFKTFFRLF